MQYHTKHARVYPIEACNIGISGGLQPLPIEAEACMDRWMDGEMDE